MRIEVFESLHSTQEYLNNKIKEKLINEQVCIVAKNQTNGIGSRGNKWDSVEDGLYFSFCKRLDSMPKDLLPQSFSIFFGYIFKDILQKLGSKVWLKYPNDLYLDNNKIGGVMCNIIGDFNICGIGINAKSTSFKSLENGIIRDKIAFLKKYFDSIETYTWDRVFKEYEKEFHKNYPFSFHMNGKPISLNNATLLQDGSLKIDDKIVYAIR